MMSFNTDSISVTMIDGLVGNDYSICLCSALHTAGIDVELIVPDKRVVNISVEYPVRYWMPTKDANRKKIEKFFLYLRYLVRLLIHVMKKNKKKRLVHVQFFRRERIESIFFLLLQSLGVRLFFTAHNVLPHENSIVDRFLRQGIYRAAERIIVHSEYIKKKLQADFGIASQKIKVVPHGNFDHYLPREPISKSEARASLNLPETAKVILFFGFIREYKGLDLLLEAFSACAAGNESLKLVIAGAVDSPVSKNRYRTKIMNISKDDSIIFHEGFIPSEKVATYFIACDIVALPYKAIDHSGLVHLAYSFGRPLLATNVGDFPEVIEDGKSGYLLKENSAECLSKTILWAFSNKDQLECMGKYARKLSETRYSWLEIAKRNRVLYEFTKDSGLNVKHA